VRWDFEAHLLVVVRYTIGCSEFELFLENGEYVLRSKTMPMLNLRQVYKRLFLEGGTGRGTTALVYRHLHSSFYTGTVQG
jgi:hypothetical protein